MSSVEHIDRILGENPIGMSECARLLGTFRGGRPCHPSTPVRWCTRGVKLVDGSVLRLEHIRMGDRLMTSRPALLRFLAAQQQPSDVPVAQPRTPAQQKRDAENADRKLDALGIR